MASDRYNVLFLKAEKALRIADRLEDNLIGVTTDRYIAMLAVSILAHRLVDSMPADEKVRRSMDGSMRLLTGLHKVTNSLDYAARLAESMESAEALPGHTKLRTFFIGLFEGTVTLDSIIEVESTDGSLPSTSMTVAELIAKMRQE